MKKKPTLTDTELEIMRVIWDLGEGTVREVHAVLSGKRQVAYTTVMTMMKILEEKGHLEKAKAGRAFVYRPVKARNQVVSNMVSDFLTRVFDGSAEALVLSLIKDNKLSNKELDEISKMIEEQK